jgi:hypothetical protein
VIKTTFRIAREVSRTHGPYTVSVGAITSRVTLNPAGARTPAPPRGAAGAGALVEVEHAAKVSRQATDGAFDDAAIIAEALEVVVPAINRVIHLISFVGGSQRQIPLLSPLDIENFLCEDLYDGAPRQVQVGNALTEGRILLREPKLAADARVTNLLGAAPPGFEDAESLWLDGLEAFYDGRQREAAIVLRAAVEVGWRAALDAAVGAYRRCAFGPIPVALLDTVAEQAADRRTPVPARLTTFSKIIFGFSFQEDWEPGVPSTKWDKLNTVFDQRHGVAHGKAKPTMPNVWDAVTLTREVLDKIRDLTDAVVRKCP